MNAKDLEAKVNEWKAQHGSIYELCREDCADIPTIAETRFVVRKPTRVEINRLAKHAQNDLTAANQNLLLDITLHPGRAELDGLFRDMPMLAASLMNGLDKIIGTAANFTARPL
ncbi:MAG: hypothetical protein HUU55_07655 [Myxococcales bacterium]|nr:hypothetical protein [Myxococcales bacterium]